MAIFGAGEKDDGASANAFKAAVEMTEAIEKINEDLKLDMPLKIGVAVNTGNVIIGNIGSDKKMK